MIQQQTCRYCDAKLQPNRSRCPGCGQWNVEQPKTAAQLDDLVLLKDVPDEDENERRIVTGLGDPCYGGGLVSVSTTLIGGAPGAGKSTITLQIANQIAKKMKRQVVYIGAEEAAKSIRARSRRLKLKYNEDYLAVRPLNSQCDIVDVIRKRKPVAVIVDSIPGFVGNDLKAAVDLAKACKKLAVELDSPFILIDHVTKEDMFAGLNALQHEVDTTITLFPVEIDTRELAARMDMLEEKSDLVYEDKIREMTTIKNRFGPIATCEFAMGPEGLVPLPELPES